MQVQKIQNSNYNTNFKANIVDSKALRAFKSELNGSEKKIFDSCVDTIEKSKDKNSYVFDFVTVRSQSSKILRKLATISKITTDKIVRHTTVLSTQKENALSLFQELAEKCAAKS